MMSDGSGYPTDAVLAAAGEIAERRGLSSEWLHDSVKVYFPTFKSPTGDPCSRWGRWRWSVADERTLLAMKMRADKDDGGRGRHQVSYSTSAESAR